MNLAQVENFSEELLRKVNNLISERDILRRRLLNINAQEAVKDFEYITSFQNNINETEILTENNLKLEKLLASI